MKTDVAAESKVDGQAVRPAMERALDLARSVLGRTSPNPAVGAVVVRGESIVGEGATQPHGGPHAEVQALTAAAGAARGATLVVTLEPCNHHGWTPACTNAILTAGIARVVAAVRDPNPVVPGGGIENLRSHGVTVEVGLCGEAAAELNYAFFKVAATGRPFVTLKWAMTLDGKIAHAQGGGSISGPDSLHQSHRLRDQSDAILIGAGTAEVDNPRLTVRPQPHDARQPVRVVLDSRSLLPSNARLLAEPGRTVIMTTPAATAADHQRLEAAGAEVIIGPSDKHDRVDLEAALDWLTEQNILNVLVEGGPRIHSSFLTGELADRIVVFLAPRIMGEGIVALDGMDSPLGSTKLDGIDVRRVGSDVMLTGYLRRYNPPLD